MRAALQDRVDDMIFVHKRIGELAQERKGPFQGLLNMDKVATLGHSFGGGTAVSFCQQVDVKCGIVLDPFLWVNGRESLLKGSPVPLLCPKSPEMLGDRDGFCCVNTGLIETLCGRSPSSWMVTLLEFGHFDFCDAIFVSPVVFRMLGLMNLPGDKCLMAHHYLADMCLAFLGEHCPLPWTSTCRFDVSKLCSQSIMCSQSIKTEWQSFNFGCNPRHQMCGLSLSLKTHGPQWTVKQLNLMRSMVERALCEGRFDKDMVHCGGDIVEATSIIFSCHSPQAIREKLLEWAIPGVEKGHPRSIDSRLHMS
ncbi:hypothetical protein CYMTET_9278 [Cymbomonas tetramitiformis]|uniref:1-alkyl-2-acetylglycerophosphocholine esterase n=1 Tax=Cymbomonas tetramitiformis TaxID=36881 RepID=A0AAE0LFN1_9CHLO|nr:hypothetical protein CYMTET_9278 [Cymbomonas tetramitiformis]